MRQEKNVLTDEPSNPVYRAVTLLGGYITAAEKLSEVTGRTYTKHAVRKWFQSRLPADVVVPIVLLLDGEMSPHDLRPDIYPDPNWMPPGMTRTGALDYRRVLELCAENPDLTPHQLNAEIYPSPHWRLPPGWGGTT